MTTDYYLKIFQNCTFWPKYICRFIKYDDTPIPISVLHMNLMSWVSGAFDWEESPEGRRFWFEISEAWREFVKSNQSNPLPYLKKWYKPIKEINVSIY